MTQEKKGVSISRRDFLEIVGKSGAVALGTLSLVGCGGGEESSSEVLPASPTGFDPTPGQLAMQTPTPVKSPDQEVESVFPPTPETGTPVVRYDSGAGEVVAAIGGVETPVFYQEYDDIKEELAGVDFLETGENEGWKIWEAEGKIFSIVRRDDDGNSLIIPIVYPEALSECGPIVPSPQNLVGVCRALPDEGGQDRIRVVDASVLVSREDIADPDIALIATKYTKVDGSSEVYGESKVLVRDRQGNWYDQGAPAIRDFSLVEGLSLDSMSEDQRLEIVNLAGKAGRTDLQFQDGSITKVEEQSTEGLAISVTDVEDGKAIAYLETEGGSKHLIGLREETIQDIQGNDEKVTVEVLVGLPPEATLDNLEIGEGESKKTLKANTFKWVDKDDIRIWNPEKRKIETVDKEALVGAPSWVEQFACHNGNVKNVGKIDIEACGYDFTSGELTALGPEGELVAEYTKLPYGEDKKGWIAVMADSGKIETPSIFMDGVVPIRLMSTKGVLTRDPNDIWPVSYGQQGDLVLYPQRGFVFNEVDSEGLETYERNGEEVQHSYLSEGRFPSRGDDALRLMTIQAAAICRGEEFDHTLGKIEAGEDVEVELPDGSVWKVGGGIDVLVSDIEPSNSIDIDRTSISYSYLVDSKSGRLGISFYKTTTNDPDRRLLAIERLFADMVEEALEVQKSTGQLTEQEASTRQHEFGNSRLPMLELGDKFVTFLSVVGVGSESALFG